MSEAAEERVLELLGIEAGLAGDTAEAPSVRSDQGSPGVVPGACAGTLEETGEGLGHGRGVAFLDDEAIFPGMGEGLAVDPPHILEFVGDGVGAGEVGDGGVVRDEKGGRGVAELCLQRAAWRAHAAVAGDDQHILRSAGFDRMDCCFEGAGPRTQGSGEVHRQHVATEIEGLGNDRRSLLLLHGVGRRGEHDAVDLGPVDPAQTVHGGGYGHGDAVLVVVCDRLLGAALLGGTALDQGKRQSGGGDVGPVRADSGHLGLSWVRGSGLHPLPN